jgi:hypothetical protein
MNETGYYVIGFGGMRVIGISSGIGNSGDISAGYITYTTIVKINFDEYMDLFHSRFQCEASLLTTLDLRVPLHE